MQVSAYPGGEFSLKITPRDQLNAITIDIATVYGRIDEVSITKDVCIEQSLICQIPHLLLFQQSCKIEVAKKIFDYRKKELNVIIRN